MAKDGNNKRARRQAKAFEDRQREHRQQNIRERREARREQQQAPEQATSVRLELWRSLRRMMPNRRSMMPPIERSMATVAHVWRRIGLADARPWWLMAYIAAAWIYTPFTSEGMVGTPEHYVYWGLRFMLNMSSFLMVDFNDSCWFLLPFLSLTYYWLPGALLLAFYFAGFTRF